MVATQRLTDWMRFLARYDIWERSHYYAAPEKMTGPIPCATKATTDDALRIEEGALYPALHRMEQRGWLAAEWGYTDANRKAKFYRLTASGRKQLTNELSRWSRYTEAVGLVIAAEGA